MIHVKKIADTETVTCLVLSENNFNPHVISMTYLCIWFDKKSKISRKNIHVNISPYTTIQKFGVFFQCFQKKCLMLNNAAFIWSRIQYKL